MSLRSTRLLLAEVPWRRIIGLRNCIVHVYFDVDLELGWEILRVELPGLETQLRGLLADAGNDPGPAH
jgi:uncharacterized protein with HEPN domain